MNLSGAALEISCWKARAAAARSPFWRRERASPPPAVLDVDAGGGLGAPEFDGAGAVSGGLDVVEGAGGVAAPARGAIDDVAGGGVPAVAALGSVGAVVVSADARATGPIVAGASRARHGSQFAVTAPLAVFRLPCAAKCRSMKPAARSSRAECNDDPIVLIELRALLLVLLAAATMPAWAAGPALRNDVRNLPIASAGPALTARVLVPVTLDGSASHDTDAGARGG